MKIRITVIALATSACLSSCKEDTAEKPLGEIPDEGVTTPSAASSNEELAPFDFETTMSLINQINNGVSYEFFQSEWKELRSELNEQLKGILVDSGQL